MSLLLLRHPDLENEPKEYNLFPPLPEKVRAQKPGQAFVFSEKDLPGYKPKTFSWDEVDEDGNPGQGRSFLYERHRREQKKKENKGRFVPYSRRPIPKQTSIAGTIAKEFDAVAVKNNEYYVLEEKKAEAMLKIPDREEADFATSTNDPEKRNRNTYMSRSEAQATLRVSHVPPLHSPFYPWSLNRTKKQTNTPNPERASQEARGQRKPRRARRQGRAHRQAARPLPTTPHLGSARPQGARQPARGVPQGDAQRDRVHVEAGRLQRQVGVEARVQGERHVVVEPFGCGDRAKGRGYRWRYQIRYGSGR